MSTSESKQQLRDARRRWGMCIDCGTGANGKLRCDTCYEKNRVSRKQYYERRKLAKNCITAGCPNKSTEGRQRCTKCASTSAGYEKDRIRPDASEYMKVWRKKRIADGKCPRCSADNTTKRTILCDVCATCHRSRHEKIKRDIFDHYGGAVCVGCNEKELAVLQLDHINGGGNKHAQKIGGRGKMYKWIKDNNYPPGFRVLCANCNVRAYRKIPFPNEVNNG